MLLMLVFSDHEPTLYIIALDSLVGHEATIYQVENVLCKCYPGNK